MILRQELRRILAVSCQLIAVSFLLFHPASAQEPPYVTPGGNAAPPVMPMTINPLTGKTQPAGIGPAPTTVEPGTIATGNTFQQLSPAASRRSFEFQNNNSSDSCWLFFGAGVPSKAKSLTVAAGAYYARLSGSIPSDVIQVTCSTANDTYWAQEQ